MTMPGEIKQREHDKFEENQYDGRTDVRTTIKNGPNNPVYTAPGNSTSNDAEIFNVNLPSANTEVSQILPLNTTGLLIRARGLSKLQFAFVATESSTKYVTIPAGASYNIQNILLEAATLYVQSNKANEVVEVLTWS